MAGKKGRSGRKPKSLLRQQTELKIAETSPYAAQYLASVARGEIAKSDPVRVDVCKYIINQDLGMPKQKTELTGEDGARIESFVFVMPGGERRTPGELAEQKQLGSPDTGA